MKPISNLVSVWFGLIMIVVLSAGSIFLMLNPDVLNDRLYGNKRTFFIVLLLAYSVYRGFRVYHLYKQTREKD